MTDRLAAFILDRLRDDENAVGVEVEIDAPLMFPAEQMYADIAAKRRIVELHEPIGPADGPWICDECTGSGPFQPSPCATLLLLALPYAAHSDYREEWEVVRRPRAPKSGDVGAWTAA
jgi:Family of unknown function (DUF6221)